MLTEVRRPPTEQEIAPHRLNLEKLQSEGRTPSAFRTVCYAIALLAPVPILLIVQDKVLGGFIAILVAFAFFMMPFAKPENQDQESKNLQDLIDHGSIVEIHVTSSRCFKVEQYDDEGSDYFLDLGEQGVLVINEYQIVDGWSPNTDFTIRYLEGSNGRQVDERVRSVGEQLEPLEVVRRGKHSDLYFEHMQVVPGTIEDRLIELRRKGET